MMNINDEQTQTYKNIPRSSTYIPYTKMKIYLVCDWSDGQAVILCCVISLAFGSIIHLIRESLYVEEIVNCEAQISSWPRGWRDCLARQLFSNSLEHSHFFLSLSLFLNLSIKQQWRDDVRLFQMQTKRAPLKCIVLMSWYSCGSSLSYKNPPTLFQTNNPHSISIS